MQRSSILPLYLINLDLFLSPQCSIISCLILLQISSDLGWFLAYLINCSLLSSHTSLRFFNDRNLGNCNDFLMAFIRTQRLFLKTLGLLFGFSLLLSGLNWVQIIQRSLVGRRPSRVNSECRLKLITLTLLLIDRGSIKWRRRDSGLIGSWRGHGLLLINLWVAN
jgi:hypothetical protein